MRRGRSLVIVGLALLLAAVGWWVVNVTLMAPTDRANEDCRPPNRCRSGGADVPSRRPVRQPRPPRTITRRALNVRQQAPPGDRSRIPVPVLFTLAGWDPGTTPVGRGHRTSAGHAATRPAAVSEPPLDGQS